ncbi:O-methyltransferase [Mycobacterium colombiense]|uniref:Methyltransferase n=1 Tax=Mycobacterium colombiense TaxID=339268 RepID=A0A1A2YHX8_9MYCO|nr:methyltransferase [Mycobacterium colombiense]
MLSTLDRAPLNNVLADLRGKARAQRAAGRPGGLHLTATASPQQRADAASDAYMAISPTSGLLLYSMVRAVRPATVIEFGMSYGISTLHLAAAARDNGSGHIFTTELSAKKVAAGKQTFAAAGVDDLITILDGDALATLGAVPGEVGVVLLDGWKEMYLPVLQLIEKQLSHGALILADNAENPGTASYLDYVRDPANGYVTINFPDKERNSTELSCRV